MPTINYCALFDSSVVPPPSSIKELNYVKCALRTYVSVSLSCNIIFRNLDMSSIKGGSFNNSYQRLSENINFLEFKVLTIQ